MHGVETLHWRTACNAYNDILWLSHSSGSKHLLRAGTGSDQIGLVERLGALHRHTFVLGFEVNSRTVVLKLLLRLFDLSLVGHVRFAWYVDLLGLWIGWVRI